MNILVVDDDNYIVEGIVKTVVWSAIGIKKVFTAFSMKQAQKVFEAEKIDILLTDIEMPKGTGFELVEWTYNQGIKPVTLFLTSHAKFEYAQKAIQMQCLGYIVKPADTVTLEDQLRCAVETKKKKDQQEQYQSLGEYWDSKLMKRTESLWHDLFRGKIQPKDKSILSAIQKEQLSPELMTREYYYILVQVELNESSHIWDKNLLNYAIRNVLSEMLYDETLSPIPDMGEDRFMMICSTERYLNEEEILASCQKAAKACENALPGKFNLYISGPGAATEAFDCYNVLKKLENEYFTTESIALSESLLKSPLDQTAPSIQIESWTDALLTHKKQLIVDQLKSFFPEGRKYYPRSLLNDLFYGILQAIYISFEKKNISTKELFVNEECNQYIADATKSMEGFFRWVSFSLEKALAELDSNTAFGYVVENVRQYVLDHIGDELLDRASIAAEIHLNPDYLSFTFKEKFGQSLSSFIASERIRAAKKLLISTDLPITEISFRTGYTDISYFSKQFKQIVGITPQQYRKSVLNNPTKI